MAKRFYLSNAAISGTTPSTKRGSWDVNSATAIFKLGAKAGAAATTAQSITTNTANWDVLLARFVTDQVVLRSAALSGTVSWMAGVQEANADANYFTHVHIFVTAGDSNTLRGTLLSSGIGSSEWPTTAAGRGQSGMTLSSVNVEPGDRIVVEIGYRASKANTTSRAGTLRYGGTNATDLSENGTNSAQPGWFEFSDPNQVFEEPPQEPYGSSYIRSYSLGGDEGGTATVARPDGLANGDRLLAIVMNDETAGMYSNADVSGSAAAWELLDDSGETLLNDRPKGRVYQKKITNVSNEPSNYTFTPPDWLSSEILLVAVADVPDDADVSIKWDDGDIGNAAGNLVAPAVSTYEGENPVVIRMYTVVSAYSEPTISVPSGHAALGEENDVFWMTARSAYQYLEGTASVATATAASAAPDTDGGIWRAVTVVVPGTLSSPPAGPEPGRFLIAC